MSAAVAIQGPRIRDANLGPEGDMGFIVDSWRRDFASTSYLCKLSRDVYFHLMAKHIAALSREDGAVIRVACDPEDAETIIGYAFVTGDELHYVYVRGGKETSMRRFGVARQLLDGLAIKTHTFETQAFTDRLKPAQRGWTYAPRTASWADGRLKVVMA